MKPGPLVEVVAAAIVRDGRVLAAHRRQPPGWEFPGGKLEPGESASAALARECREELDVGIVPGRIIAVADDGRIRLTLLAATMRFDETPRTGADHNELRWLATDELLEEDHDVALVWLPLDRVLLHAVAASLRDANRTGKF